MPLIPRTTTATQEQPQLQRQQEHQHQPPPQRQKPPQPQGKNNRMAIVHVAFKSSSTAPPAAAHAQYIAREGQYLQRGGVKLVKSGNMPEFAQADPHSFWVANGNHHGRGNRPARQDRR